MLLLRVPFSLKKIPWIPMAIMAIISTAIPWALIGFSETKLTSSMTSILNATTPLWTVVVGMLFFKAVVSRMQWIGLGVAFLGLLFLLGINKNTIISVDFLGFIGMMGSSLCYAVGSQLSKRMEGVSMYQMTFGTLLCSMLFSGVAALLFESISMISLLSPANIGSLVGLGVFGSGIGYILFYYMIQKGSPEFATTVTYLVPASAILWGSTLLDEKIHMGIAGGLVFILTGVFLASKRRSAGTVVRKMET